MWCEKFNSFVYPAYLSHQRGVTQALFDDVYVIFPMHVNFPITSRFVLKATIHENKNSELFYVTWESFFFKKTLLWYCASMLYLINFSVLPQCVLIFHVPLSIIYQLFFTISRDALYTRRSIRDVMFLRDFPFSSFPLIF